MRCALYVRVSTLDQHPENQLVEIRRYVQARGWATPVEYIDHGVSGAQERRPALDRLIADATRRRLDVVVCWRLDRLGRNLKHLVLLLEEFHSLGVAFVSLTEGIDATTPAGKLQLHILAAIADYAKREIMRSDRAGGRVFSALQRCGTPHYPRSCRDAIRASGALNRPRRNSGGKTASIAASFSAGSIRK